MSITLVLHFRVTSLPCYHAPMPFPPNHNKGLSIPTQPVQGSIWERLPAETPADHAKFLDFCRSSSQAETISEYVARVFPGDETALEMATNNQWWDRRVAYLNALKDIVAARAQSASYVGVQRVVETALGLHERAVAKLNELNDLKVDVNSQDYRLALQMFERIAKILTTSAQAVTKIEIKQINATQINNQDGKTSAVFSSKWGI